jgi:hypothetical protein
LRVAQFLANLWQGPCAAVHAMDAGFIVWCLATADWHLRCSAVFRRLRAERRVGGLRSSVMAGCSSTRSTVRKGVLELHRYLRVVELQDESATVRGK